MDTCLVRMRVNGRPVEREVPARKLLSDFLREDAGALGVNVGCEQGVCGSCTVLVDGVPARACLAFAVQVDGAEIRTVEGLTTDGSLHPLQQAFHDHHALQCGFCTPGMIITAYDFLARHPRPSIAEIREALSGNLCRCTGYQQIVEAVQDAARLGAVPEGGER
ncbi:MAG: (2Fe-2S)-binding protein [Candidatus Rokubacteria bacterium]|nr:(2Fe-2S)-binding protein [Candidatus Rokubacteria bacterium]